MQYTDKTIPIECSECGKWEEGVRSMTIHILESHPDYEPGIAYAYARKWADDAYDANHQHEMNQTFYARGK